MCLAPDLSAASYRYSKPPPKVAGHAPGRPSNAEVDTSSASPDTARIVQLIVHKPIDPEYCSRPGLGHRPISGSFLDDNPQEGTETETNHPAVDGGIPSRNARLRVKASFDGELPRIIGKIEMLEILIDYSRNRADTMAVRLKQLDRGSGK